MESSLNFTRSELINRYYNGPLGSEFVDHYDIYSDLIAVANQFAYYLQDGRGKWPELSGSKDDLVRLHLGLSLVISSASNCLLRLTLAGFEGDKERDKILEVMEL